MLFCPKCGSLMKPSDGSLRCSCGYVQQDGFLKDKKKKNKEVEVVEQRESHPIIEQECPKCKHKKAYHWSRQTRSSDEPETLFFKCVRCGNTWREY